LLLLHPLWQPALSCQSYVVAFKAAAAAPAAVSGAYHDLNLFQQLQPRQVKVN
jgi:hypothetical protein